MEQWKDDGRNIIDCIGVEGGMHKCQSYEKVTFCGINVIDKKVTAIDRTTRFGCYECDGRAELITGI